MISTILAGIVGFVMGMFAMVLLVIVLSDMAEKKREKSSGK